MERENRNQGSMNKSLNSEDRKLTREIEKSRSERERRFPLQASNRTHTLWGRLSENRKQIFINKRALTQVKAFESPNC